MFFALRRISDIPYGEGLRRKGRGCVRLFRQETYSRGRICGCTVLNPWMARNYPAESAEKTGIIQYKAVIA